MAKQDKKNEEPKNLSPDQEKVYKKLLTAEMLRRITARINEDDADIVKSITNMIHSTR